VPHGCAVVQGRCTSEAKPAKRSLHNQLSEYSRNTFADAARAPSTVSNLKRLVSHEMRYGVMTELGCRASAMTRRSPGLSGRAGDRWLYVESRGWCIDRLRPPSSSTPPSSVANSPTQVLKMSSRSPSVLSKSKYEHGGIPRPARRRRSSRPTPALVDEALHDLGTEQSAESTRIRVDAGPRLCALSPWRTQGKT
jgi:hypothetical protein